MWSGQVLVISFTRRRNILFISFLMLFNIVCAPPSNRPKCVTTYYQNVKSINALHYIKGFFFLILEETHFVLQLTPPTSTFLPESKKQKDSKSAKEVSRRI